MNNEHPTVHLILQCTVQDLLQNYSDFSAALYAALQRMTVGQDWIDRLEGIQSVYGLVTIEPTLTATKHKDQQD